MVEEKREETAAADFSAAPHALKWLSDLMLLQSG